MTNAIAQRESNALSESVVSPATLAAVILDGDLVNLSDPQRVEYAVGVCKTLGLNPATRPFDYIKLNGKLVMYARRDCTDQLRQIHKVSITIKDRSIFNDVFTVTANAMDRNGRVDESIGAVAIAGLKGEALANALMKAETKAKRRVTLSICGLGLLDESEIDNPGMTLEERNAAAASSDQNAKPVHNLDAKAEASRLWVTLKEFDKQAANLIKRECGSDAERMCSLLRLEIKKHVNPLTEDEKSELDERAAIQAVEREAEAERLKEGK